MLVNIFQCFLKGVRDNRSKPISFKTITTQNVHENREFYESNQFEFSYIFNEIILIFSFFCLIFRLNILGLHQIL